LAKTRSTWPNCCAVLKYIEGGGRLLTRSSPVCRLRRMKAAAHRMRIRLLVS
jgi:hypothetical protein